MRGEAAAVATRSPPAPAEPSASVVVLANAADPDSLALADYYLERRGIPRENLVALSMPTTETIRWPEFVAAIWRPLQEALIQRGWIDTMLMATTDVAGRPRQVVTGHRLAYLAVCRGVPLRIEHRAEFLSAAEQARLRREFRTNGAAVDSELSLLAFDQPRINGYLPNPLFALARPGTPAAAAVVKVSRLDGPSLAAARALIDSALTAERDGLIGRYYVDVGGGPHPDGDRWLHTVQQGLTALGFDGDLDSAPATFPASARFETPAWYFGWYAADVRGPFTLPGFRFAPGAIAVHLHSFSAQTLRTESGKWAGPLVARGAAGVLGNVAEPYLQLLHRPDLFLGALVQGATLADAAYAALPVLSWQSIVIGDPLYRPLARGLDEQWARRSRLPGELQPALHLRRQHEQTARGQAVQARVEEEAAFAEAPSWPLALAAARASSDDAARQAALARLRAVPLAPGPTAPTAGLWAEAARVLVELGDRERALQVYEVILERADLSAEVRDLFLPEALELAERARDAPRQTRWAALRLPAN